MAIQRQKIRSETRITSSFEIDKKKFRLCYMPRGGPKVAALQLNYYINGIEPYVRRIIEMGKYQVIRLYLNQKYMQASYSSLDAFIESLSVPGYRCISPAGREQLGTSQELREYVHICTIEREK